MKYITDISKLKLNNTVVTIGKFDGNHIGHKYLFDTVVKLKEYAMDAVVFTFSDAIKKVSTDIPGENSTDIPGENSTDIPGENSTDTDIMHSKKNTSKFIFTNFEKRNYAYPEGIDYIIECRFVDEIKNMTPEEFIEKILVGKLGVRKIVVGNDFCFGKDRMGDVKTLYDYSGKFKYEVYPMEKVLYDGIEVSSTYIKKKISEGDMEAVNDMLGEPFSITGTVVHGKQLGREIGFPTINFLADDKKILPPDGVYATKTHIGDEEYISISNIGKQPTIDDDLQRTVETHIFDHHEDLYGKELKVDLYKFIRPEKKFSGIDELKAEIAVNKEEVLGYFNL